MAKAVSCLTLLVWVGIQPWLLWSSLSPDVSHRLTLTLCCVAMGMATMTTLRWSPTRLTTLWVWVVSSCLLVMAVHQWAVVRDASYFRFFRETALFSDGVILLVAGYWGVWALCQLPRSWMRRLRWAGLVMISLNLIFALAQLFGHQWHLGSFMPASRPSGVMGYDRLMGAYAIAWLPILWSWQWWLGLLPTVLVILSAKVSEWVGMGVVWWRLFPKWRWVSVPLTLVGAMRLTDGSLVEKVGQRLMTWKELVRVCWTHPWVGFGFSPMAMPQAMQGRPFPLPSGHSDWLSLAFHAGWIVCIIALVAWWKVISTTPTTRQAWSVQTSLLSLGVMAGIQSVVSHPRIAGLVLVLLSWWWIEQQQPKECSP